MEEWRLICKTCGREWASADLLEKCRLVHEGIGFEPLDTISPCFGPAKDPKFPATGERRSDGSVAGFSWRDRYGLLHYFRHEPVGATGYLV